MGFIISDRHDSHVSWGVWGVHETVEELLDGLVMSEFDKHEFELISHPTRIMEWVAARKAMQTLALDFGINYKGIVKEANGKSFLKDNKTSISISHTKDYAAVIVHSEKSVGIDIELLKEKIELIAHKFISMEEFEFIEKDMDKLTIAWCVKEAVYKCLGVDGISFKDHIRLDNFEVKAKGELHAKIIHPDYLSTVELRYIKKDNFCLAYTL